jgi:hypothetical protein
VNHAVAAETFHDLSVIIHLSIIHHHHKIKEDILHTHTHTHNPTGTTHTHAQLTQAPGTFERGACARSRKRPLASRVEEDVGPGSQLEVLWLQNRVILDARSWEGIQYLVSLM